jgi:RNA polymerase sigma-70 factor (ECF subfamily)
MTVTDGTLRGALLDRARRHDGDAFAELVHPRLAGLLRTATAILGHEEDASDALQDALTRAWRGMSGLRDEDRFDAWLTRILVNECRTALKRRTRTRIREIAVDVGPADREVASRSAAVAESVVGRIALEAAFERLSADERTILVLHHLDGRPLAEVAGLLGIPVGTAKSRLHAARVSLERNLGRQR